MSSTGVSAVRGQDKSPIACPQPLRLVFSQRGRKNWDVGGGGGSAAGGGGVCGAATSIGSGCGVVGSDQAWLRATSLPTPSLKQALTLSQPLTEP